MPAIRHACISGVGSYVPPRVVTNDDLAKLVDTSDEWIRSRSGIRERHFAEAGQGASDMALPAAQQAIARAGLTPADIDGIIFATVTPDTIFPSSANNLQAKLGCRPIMSYDLLAACSGFLYGLQSGFSLVASGAMQHVLVVGAEVMTSILNFEDRATCVLFGDGGGAVVISPGTHGGYREAVLASDGCQGEILKMPAGGSQMPASRETVEHKLHYVHMQGREVYKQAITNMTAVTQELLGRVGMNAEDLSLVLIHQANKRIVDAVLKQLDLPAAKTWVNIHRFGNTTAATLPLLMDESWRAGRLAPGDQVLLLSFGAGTTWGAMLFEWTLAPPLVIEELSNLAEMEEEEEQPVG